jgi:hypothetical protein
MVFKDGKVISFGHSFGVYTKPNTGHHCQKSVNLTHPGKHVHGSVNPTHFATGDTVFRKFNTISGNPTHRSAIVAWQWMLSLLIHYPASFSHILAVATPHNGRTRSDSDAPP